MTEHLLDTNIAILSLKSPEKLPAPARRAIQKGQNVLSVITYWEVMLKCMKGKLDVGDPRVCWLDALDQLAATTLPLNHDHVSQLRHLPPLHFDPFDRVLIAQAVVEGMVLVTMDEEILRYGVEGFRTIH